MCLVCNQHVAVLKVYNIRRHYDTHNKDKFYSLQGQLRKDCINELLAGLKKNCNIHLLADAMTVMGQ